MKSAIVTCLAISLSACSSYPSDEAEGWEGEPVASTQQALVNAKVKYITAFGPSRAAAACPSDRPFVLGGGHTSNGGDGADQATALGLAFPSTQVVEMFDNSDIASATAACSNAQPIRVSNSDNDPDATATCPADHVAVGGGGTCSSGARLVRSRPSPDTHGVAPTGWRATCSSGTIKTMVQCMPKGVEETFNFNDCRVERSDDDDSQQDVGCGSTRRVTAAGAYCGGSGAFIERAWISTPTVVDVSCGSDIVHAYAICCGHLTVEP